MQINWARFQKGSGPKSSRESGPVRWKGHAGKDIHSARNSHRHRHNVEEIVFKLF